MIYRDGNTMQISITGKLYERLTRNMQRDNKGRIIAGQIAGTVDRIVNAALDRETGRS